MWTTRRLTALVAACAAAAALGVVAPGGTVVRADPAAIADAISPAAASTLIKKSLSSGLVGLGPAEAVARVAAD
ncbi:MAG TPA: hypothetical protein VE172_25160, partial [Stackebrandtia sp.]